MTGAVSRVTDQAGKERRQVVDILGRMVRVDEPTAGGLGPIASPYQPTFYEYDGNDNLSKVIQPDGSTTQERKFKYDSLSRLVAEKQVEASPTLDLNGTRGTADPATKWTKVLKYDTHGLLTDGYDARGVRTQIAYDGKNRVSGVTYSGETGDQTPEVTYTYDQTRSGSYNVGALTRVETAAVGDTPATATEFDFDAMGRVAKHRQYIASQEYDLEYGYNLAGQLASEKYPSGRVVANSYDASGRLASILDASRTYLSGLSYQGNAGSLSSMTFGNGTVQTFGLNDRLQMTSQELKKGANTIQKYNYGYGQIDASGNLNTTENNGQLSQIESYIGTAKQWTQKFAYDAVGRLSESKEYRGDNASLTYKQSFDFDRFGNMYRKAAKNGTSGQANPLPYTPIEDSDISKSTNRFTTGSTYDESGNVTTDNKFRSMSLGYDVNGRMVKAVKPNVPDALSVYDAAGIRVAERVNDVWRFLIYDVGGKLISEYGGPQSTDEGGVKYLCSDWQGSTRAVVSSSGFVNYRADYTAFGEDIGAAIGQRTTTQGYSAASSVRQKYGLTERDDATGFDHTWFRKNENRAGRWTSPDPYGGSMLVGDPQSFNRYSYVGNEPTNYVDPSGLNESSTTFQWCEPDRWDPSTLTLYPGKCFQYVMGGGSTVGTTVSSHYPVEIGVGGGPGDDHPLPFNNCATFVTWLRGVALETYRNAEGNKAAAAKSLGAGLMDLAFFGYERHIHNGYEGFKDELVVPGGQGAGVYGHVLGMSGSQLYGVVGGVIGSINSLVDHVQNFYGKADKQGPAEVAGNKAGTAVGNHLWSWIGGSNQGSFKNLYDLEQDLRGELCK